MFTLERTLLWIVRGGLFLTLFVPLVSLPDLFFPFITGKAFAFRFLVEVVFASWLLLCALKRDMLPRLSPVSLSLLGFLVIVSLAGILGADPYHSFWSNFERMEGLVTLFHVAAFFTVLGHTIKAREEWIYFFHCSLGVSLITAMYGFLQWRGIVKIIGESRIYSTFGNSIYFAVYLMFHLFIILVFLYHARVRWLRVFYGVFLLFELGIFFLAASRGAFIGLAAGVVFIAASLLIIARNRTVRLGALAVIFFLGILAGTIFLYPESTVVKKYEVFSRLSSVSLQNLQDDPRVMIWGIAWDAFRERPILGWGPENFVLAYSKYYNPNLFGSEAWFDRAHNTLLEWLVATGILGLAAYFLVFAAAAHVLVRLVKQKRVDMFTATVIGGFFVAYLVQNAFVFDNVVTYIVIVSVLVFIHAQTVEPAGAREKKPHQGIIVIATLGVVVAGFALYYSVILPALVARQMITALNSLTSSQPVEVVIQQFKRAIEYNTFGTTEARERVADVAVQIALNVEGTNEAYFKLLNFSIEELEKEAAARSHVARSHVFLGKLYTIRHNISGDSFEKAEASYKRALELSPNYIQNYLGLAELYLIAGQKEKAVEAARAAFSKPTKLSTLGSLFFPVLSVHVLAGEFQEAVKFMQEHQKKTGVPLFGGPTNEDIYLLIQRANSSPPSAEKIIFYEEWNRMFINDYGFPQPAVLGELINTYNALGERQKARDAIAGFANEDMKGRARAFADDILKNSASPEAARVLVNKFISSLEALP